MTSTPRPGQTEFIAGMAALTALVAFSIDAMLPALPQIAGDLSADAPNKAQLIVTTFLFGMGIGTLFVGPMSDTYGRKPILLGGVILYMIGAYLCFVSPSLTMLMVSRIIMGIGAAGPRVVTLAIVRDRYAGQGMAQIMSFIMMVFSLIPAVAPAVGQILTNSQGWRSLFVAFVAFAVAIGVWMLFRQPETLSKERRSPFSFSKLKLALVLMFGNRTVVLSILAQVFCYTMLFATLSSVQPTFDIAFNQGAAFPYYFAAIALFGAGASFVNAKFVGRIGMRAMILIALLFQMGFATAMIATVILNAPTLIALCVYFVWIVAIFFQFGLTFGNLNALAMEPLGDIAGFASSVIMSLATIGAVLLAIPIGLAFDGTPLPAAISSLVLALLASIATGQIKR